MVARDPANANCLGCSGLCSFHVSRKCSNPSFSAMSTLDSTRTRPTAAARSGCGILASMITFRTRRRRWWLGAITTALVVSLAALLLKPMLEHGVRARIESEAVRHGAVARIGLVHVGV